MAKIYGTPFWSKAEILILNDPDFHEGQSKFS